MSEQPDIARIRGLAGQVLQTVADNDSSGAPVKIEWLSARFPQSSLEELRKALDLLVKARRIGISVWRPLEHSWIWWTDTRPAKPPNGPLDIEDVQVG